MPLVTQRRLLLCASSIEKRIELHGRITIYSRQSRASQSRKGGMITTCLKSRMMERKRRKSRITGTHRSCPMPRSQPCLGLCNTALWRSLTTSTPPTQTHDLYASVWSYTSARYWKRKEVQASPTPDHVTSEIDLKQKPYSGLCLCPKPTGMKFGAIPVSCFQSCIVW